MRLLIAGGGTGGHLYPGIAVADEFRRRDRTNEVLFVGTRRGLEARVLSKKNYALKFLLIQGWLGKNPLEKLKTLIFIPISFFQSLKILIQFKPDVVLGIGGYASFPVLCAAFFLRKKMAIHEQNVQPGLTNRLLSRLVNKIFVSFEDSKSFFPAEKVIVTGNPIRILSKEGKPHDRFTLFIFGGSQGAHSLNRAFLEALPYLSDVKDKIHVVHQSGQRDLQWCQETYVQQKWNVELYPFIDDIGDIYSKSDFIICRAGASSLSELSHLQKACLLIPYPFASHGHQEKNAKLLEQKGAARVLLDWQLNGTDLATEIKWAFQNPRELETLRKNILRFSRPFATKAIVDQIVSD